MVQEHADITTREDIVHILESFYKRAFADELIGRFFTEVVPLDLETHVPIIADFWETILLNERKYSKNVMQIHQHISSLSPINKQHLDRWVQLMIETIDEMYSGDRATLMKQRARSIATLMEMKLVNSP